MKNLVIFYHGNCLDGKAAAVTTVGKYQKDRNYSLLFDKVHTFPVNYSDSISKYHEHLDGVTADEILFVDFTPPADIISFLLKFVAAHGIYILDHHKTAQKDYLDVLTKRFGGSIHAVYDNTMSGAMMAYRYDIDFARMEITKNSKKAVPKFLRLVDIRDRWVLEDKQMKADADALQAYAFLSGWVETGDDIPNTKETDLMVKKGYVAHDTRMEIAKSILSKAPSFDISNELNPNTRIVYGLVPEGLSSIFGELAYTRYPEVNTLAVAIAHDPFIKQTFVSLRSNVSLDCSKVAKAFGGGGHKNASGCRIVGLDLKEALDKITEVASNLDLLDN